MTTHRHLSLIVAAALTFTALQAQAQNAADPVLAKTVDYADLNIDSPQGSKVLLARLRKASATVCSPLASLDLGIRSHWLDCMDKAMTAAVDKINNRTLKALYAQQKDGSKG